MATRTFVLAQYIYYNPKMPNNIHATEPQVQVVDVNYYENAERVNGQLAMIGFLAALGSYIFTGQIIPGVF